LEGAKTKPHVWWRYLDDIFMIWAGNEGELREFIEYLNNLHPTIKFTSEQSSSSVAFLAKPATSFKTVCHHVHSKT